VLFSVISQDVATPQLGCVTGLTVYMEVRFHTFGQILEGKYKGWYVFVQTYKNNQGYLILLSNNQDFGKDKEGNLIEGSQGYDSWMPDKPSLENHFQVNVWQIEWLDDWHLSWVKDVAE